jgi:hypothetical protein
MPELRPPYEAIRVAKALEVGVEIDLDAGATKSFRFREINEKEAFTLRDATRRAPTSARAFSRSPPGVRA